MTAYRFYLKLDGASQFQFQHADLTQTKQLIESSR
jgi:hypothetical protein